MRLKNHFTRKGAARFSEVGGLGYASVKVINSLPTFLFLLLFIIMWIVQGSLSSDLLVSVLETTLPLILVAAGQTLVVFTRGIDLSVGGVFSLVSAILATRATTDADAPVWLLIALLASVLAGAVNGGLVAFTRIQPFIVTLATWSILGGIALLILPTEGGSIAPGISAALSGAAGVPKALLFVLGIALLWWVFRRSGFGATALAIGSNDHSAFLNGMRVKFTLIAVYAISGLLSGLGAVYYSAVVTYAGSPVAGEPFILLSIAAVVLGGTSLAGGRGSVFGTILGALSLSVIAQIVFFTGLQSYWSQFIQGMLILLAVIAFAAADFAARRRII